MGPDEEIWAFRSIGVHLPGRPKSAVGGLRQKLILLQGRELTAPRATPRPSYPDIIPENRFGEDSVMGIIQNTIKTAVLAFILALAFAPRSAEAASAAKINADVRATLDQFFLTTPGARALANSAAGVLVFPTVVKAGIGFGGEYGDRKSTRLNSSH